MTLLLAFLTATIVIGLKSDRLNGKTVSLLVLSVALTTFLYFAFERFMSLS
jgi:hypothetical protein